jgi:hypothetical protein
LGNPLRRSAARTAQRAVPTTAISQKFVKGIIPFITALPRFGGPEPCKSSKTLQGFAGSELRRPMICPDPVENGLTVVGCNPALPNFDYYPVPIFQQNSTAAHNAVGAASSRN